MSAAARSPLLHPAARFAKRHNVLAVRVQMMVFRVTAANCSREMTSSPNVHLEVNRALKTCFRNKRWVLSTARALGALLFDAGSVAFAAPCNAAISLTGYPLVAALSMKRPARTPRSSLHAVAASGRARARFGVGMFFFCCHLVLQAQGAHRAHRRPFGCLSLQEKARVDTKNVIARPLVALGRAFGCGGGGAPPVSRTPVATMDNGSDNLL